MGLHWDLYNMGEKEKLIDIFCADACVYSAQCYVGNPQFCPQFTSNSTKIQGLQV